MLIPYFSFNFAAMKKILTFISLYFWAGQVTFAQQACLWKLSPMLRQYVMQEREAGRMSMRSKSVSRIQKSVIPSTMAFVKLTHADERLLKDEGCRVWAQWGNLYVASIPMNKLAHLSLLTDVQRVEANRQTSCTMDSAIVQVNALPVYEAQHLPQAYTGKGVVMGIMDIGFDLTHPNFYNPLMSEYRIKAFWDQISSDTLQSKLPVGREYVGMDELLKVGCSTDGHDQTHGTHTLGIAAGSGGEGSSKSLPGKHHGMAYDSDICLVTNATSENQDSIASSQLYKFTYAMDALGFKYIFDYADRVGKPCVISFSEGSSQDFDGTDVLYNEVLDSLTSKPGHIIVSSAGNNGHLYYYMHKPMGMSSSGFFVNNQRRYVYHIAKSSQPFTFRTDIYENRANPHHFDVTTQQVLDSPDSTYIQQVEVAGRKYVLMIGAYPSAYHSDEICYDWIVKKPETDEVLESSEDNHEGQLGVAQTSDDEVTIGEKNHVSYQVIGDEADVAVYHGSGNMYVSSVDPSLNGCEKTHSINSPSCSENVICVGATIGRSCSVDDLGNKHNVQALPVGSLDVHSSIGPTFDERIKPDLVAPGINVLSSYSSYYQAKHPMNRNDNYWYGDLFDYQGRSYGWAYSSGTSMASPIVGGAIALWLQANPSLTRQDVFDIIRKTSKPLDETHEVPNNDWGYGELDVYAGLLSALHLDEIDGISQNQPMKAQVQVTNGEICIELSEKAEKSFVISIYNLQGMRLSSHRVDAGSNEYRLKPSLPSSLHHEVLIVQLSGYKEVNGSTLIRL